MTQLPPLALQVIDLRDEIAAFELEHRHWPRSGSVSKPALSCERPPRPVDRIQVYARIPSQSAADPHLISP